MLLEQALFGWDWAAILVVVTAVLAGATVWLGFQTRDMARETRKLAGTTVEEMDLLRAQTKAQQEQADLFREQLSIAAEDRRIALRPTLYWTLGGASPRTFGDAIEWTVQLLLRNDGPMAFADTFSFSSTTVPLGAPTVSRIAQQIATGKDFPCHARFQTPPPGFPVDYVVDVKVSARLLQPGAPLVEVLARIEYEGLNGGVHVVPVD